MGAGLGHDRAYRPEVDGLRAIAVASVVLYHINKSWLPGGYVGVDIFFVISGFLITSIIWRELQGGTFSLSDFYLRRIRRIIPVMLVVVAATLLAGAFLLLPEALGRLSLSTIFSVASAANIYFWRYLDDDYFAEASDQEPLLHLWSLGVEEQFYLVWPLLLMLVATARRNTATLAIVLALMVSITSFAIAEATNESNTKFSYFMLPARAGELMIGALLALALKRDGHARWVAKPVLADLVAVIGLAAIGCSLFLLDDQSSFPGINAAYPCIGAALVILAGGDSRILRWLLANRVMVWIGLLSYSLYLWHWPILAFIRYFHGTVGPLHGGAAVAVMLVLSVLSYRYVERPTRRVRWPAARQVAVLFLVPAVLVVAFAAYIVCTEGLKSRIESSAAYQQGLLALEEDTAPAFDFDYNCQLSVHVPGIMRERRCVVGSTAPTDGEPRVLVWGDSHAAHHVGLLDLLGQRSGIVIRNASHSSCPPVFGGDYSYGRFKAGCLAFVPLVREHVRNREFDVVILGASWAAYDRQHGFRSDLVETIREVREAGARVVLLGQVPVLGSYNRECDMRWIRLGGSNCSELKVRNKERAVNTWLASLATADGAVSYLDVGEAICDADSCPAYLEGKPIYFNKTHLSMRGSRRVGEYLIKTGQAQPWLDAIAGKGAGLVAAATPRGGPAAGRAPRSPVVKASPEGKLPGGLVLEVPHAVVSDDTIDEPGISRRKVVVEFEQVDAERVGPELVEALRVAGYRHTSSSSRRGGQRFNFRANGGVKATVLVLPRAPDAAGDRSGGTIEMIHSWPRSPSTDEPPR